MTTEDLEAALGFVEVPDEEKSSRSWVIEFQLWPQVIPLAWTPSSIGRASMVFLFPFLASLFFQNSFQGDEGCLLPQLRDLLLDEARALDSITRAPPHSNIVRYRGCRVKRGRVTGIVLDKVHARAQALASRRICELPECIDPLEPFMDALLTSAVGVIYTQAWHVSSRTK